MAKVNTDLYEGSSWGDVLRQYKQERVEVGWKPEDVPVKRETRYEQSRKERIKDPILGRFRDPSLESKTKAEEDKKLTQKLNAARDRQLNYSQTFNIVNHHSNCDGLAGEISAESQRLLEGEHKNQRRNRIPNTRVSYNILSNQGHKEHSLEKDKDELFKEEPLGATGGGEGGWAPAQGRKTLKPTTKSSDFNVVSNKYHQDHDLRDSLDRQHAKEVAERRFKETRDYNPITVSHYDSLKEQATQEYMKSLAANPGEKQFSRMPRSIRYREGAVYNVVSNTVKDSDKLRSLNTLETRALSNKVRNKIEKECHERSLINQERELKCQISRVSHQRFAQGARGFDPISNQSLQGNNSKRVFAPYTAKEKSVWDRVSVPDHPKSIAQARGGRAQNSASRAREEGLSQSGGSRTGSAPAIPKLDLSGTTGGS